MSIPNESIRRTLGRTVPLRGMLAVALLAAGAGLAACVDDQPLGPGLATPHGPSFTLNPACDSALGGVVHQDSVLAPETWNRVDNPHRVNEVIWIHGAGVLTLQPGVLVCFGAGAALGALGGGRIVANGLDTARIVLTAADADSGWWGVHMAGAPASGSSLRNVRLEHTRTVYSLSTNDSHAAALDSVVFRQIEHGLHLWGSGTSIRRSRLDTVTSATVPAVALGTSTTFEKTVIRRAAGIGLDVVGTSGVSLLGGRIEGSGGVGMRVTTPGYAFTAAQPVRIMGGASYPAEMVVSAFPKLYLGPSAQDSLLGNARDTVVITGGNLQWYANATSRIPWRVTADIFVQWVGILHATAGATLKMAPGVRIVARGGGTVVARGTAAAPVLLTGTAGAGWHGISLEGEPALPSYLTNVRIEHVEGETWVTATAVLAFDQHAVAIDSAVFRQNGGAVSLFSQGSRLSRSRVDTTLTMTAVELYADAILESTLIRGSASDGVGIHSSTVQVRSCEIRDSRWWGIVVWVAAPVHNCNVLGSPWGLVNVSGDSIDATDNWWGDAGGPGVVGNSTSGPVTYTPWRTTPYVLSYVP
jgi:hypothetical protein